MRGWGQAKTSATPKETIACSPHQTLLVLVLVLVPVLVLVLVLVVLVLVLVVPV
jgi:hypothetical protein